MVVKEQTTNHRMQPDLTSDHGVSHSPRKWIRGVNIGGWLMAERFITPYLFAVNTCHLRGDMCWYSDQIGVPKESFKEDNDSRNISTINTLYCDPLKCLPVRPVEVIDGNADYHPRHAEKYMDYPIDELSLSQAFVDKDIGRMYMRRHWDTFVTKTDVLRLKQAGVTHVRVPMSFWIRGNILPGEPWIDGGWPYFVRFAHWCREVGGIQIWADLHGAPGSENGFDNSGQYLGKSTCKGWSSNSTRVDRTLAIIADISSGIVAENLTDVVTGFGLLNEPFLDCEDGVLRDYYNKAFQIVRSTIGNTTAVFVGDMFQAWRFNDGWWGDSEIHHDTYLDSHPYHVFFEKGRAFTPKQHVAYVCRHNSRDVTSCCHDDYLTDNIVPTSGISRIVGEWSAAYDSLPTALTPYIMRTIADTGRAPFLNRSLSAERRAFMRRFVEAQMVAYEAKSSGVSSGWLFWNFKMECVRVFVQVGHSC